MQFLLQFCYACMSLSHRWKLYGQYWHTCIIRNCPAGITGEWFPSTKPIGGCVKSIFGYKLQPCWCYKTHLFSLYFVLLLSVATNKPEEITKTTWKDSAVQCPLCYQHFSSKEIEAHASDCQGEPSSPQPSHSHSQRTEPSVSRWMFGSLLKHAELAQLSTNYQRNMQLQILTKSITQLSTDNYRL